MRTCNQIDVKLRTQMLESKKLRFSFIFMDFIVAIVRMAIRKKIEMFV